MLFVMKHLNLNIFTWQYLIGWWWRGRCQTCTNLSVTISKRYEAEPYGGNSIPASVYMHCLLVCIYRAHFYPALKERPSFCVWRLLVLAAGRADWLWSLRESGSCGGLQASHCCTLLYNIQLYTVHCCTLYRCTLYTAVHYKVVHCTQL